MKVLDNTNHTFREVWDYYRDIRLNNLLTEKYRHTLWVLFWPIFVLVFVAMERLLPLLTEQTFHTVWCPLDDYIPLWSSFIVFYCFWFLFLVLTLGYALLFNPRAFRNAMRFICLTFTVCLVIYCIYPTKQELRPAQMPDNSVFSRILAGIYAIDTNTNVCPSLHVLGTLGGCFALWQCRPLKKIGWRLGLVASTVLISISTCFCKQHSAVDVLMALLLSIPAYFVVYSKKKNDC